MTHLTMLHGDICSTETLGFSGEGRAIRAIKIGRFDGTKSVVFFEAGIHAREWIAPMTAVYLMRQLIENSHSVLDTLDIIIIPVANPDGYEYSHEFVSITNHLAWTYINVENYSHRHDFGEKLEVQLLTVLASVLTGIGTLHMSGDTIQM